MDIRKSDVNFADCLSLERDVKNYYFTLYEEHMAQIRNEYPRPQFRRKDWIGLNGEWDFAFDDDRRGLRDGWQNGNILFDKKINVPFTYEFPASGLEERLFLESGIYCFF